MKASLHGLLTLCLVLAAATAVAKVMALLIILTALAAIVTRPRETIALVTTLGVLNLVALYPLPALVLVGALAIWRLRSGKPRHHRPGGERALDSAIRQIKGRR